MTSKRHFVLRTGLLLILSAACLSALAGQGNSQEAVLAALTSRLSVDSAGNQGESGKGSFNPSVSTDGAHVAFWSQAALAANDTNARTDVYVRSRELSGTKTVRVSVSSSGTQGNGDSYLPSLSSAGRLVAFYSESNNLIDNDTNTCTYYSITGTCPDVFVHDRDRTGDGILDTAGDIRTVRVSVASDGSQANGMSLFPALSADGRYVAFVSLASNLVANDLNNQADIFVYDMNLPNKVVRVSVSTEGIEANGPSGFTGLYHGPPAISSSGRFVVFHSAASNLVTGDTNQTDDIFVRDRDTDNNGIFDEPGGVKTVRMSVSSELAQGDNWSLHPSVSANGRFVVFSSLAANLVAGDVNAVADVFLHDRDADGNNTFDETGAGIRTTRISVSTSGTEANGASEFPALAADGGTIAFRSLASNLISSDGNGKADVFLADRSTGVVSRISVDSAGLEANDASGASPNVTGPASFDRGAPAVATLGRFISFHSLATNLISGDTNGASDVFLHDRSTDVTSTTISTTSTTTSTSTSTTGSTSTTSTTIIVIPTTTSTTSTSSTSSTSTSTTTTSTSTSSTTTSSSLLISTTSTSTTSTSTTSTTTTSTSTSSTTTTLPVLGPSTLLEFPQIALGGGYRTSLFLYNPSTSSVQITVRFISPQGLPLGVTINGALVNAFNTVLGPLASLNVRLEDSGELKTGWCQVFSSWPISGLAVYQSLEGNKVISEATVYPSPRWKKMAVAAPQMGALNDTGIAIANPTDSPVSISMRLISSAGVIVSSSSFMLDARQQVARFVSQYFPGVGAVPEGVVEIYSTQVTTAIGLLYQFQGPIQGNNVFTTIPVLPLP